MFAALLSAMQTLLSILFGGLVISTLLLGLHLEHRQCAIEARLDALERADGTH